MLQSQRDTTAICVRHTESKPVKRRFDQWDEDALREAMMPKGGKGPKRPPGNPSECGKLGGTASRKAARERHAIVLTLLKAYGPLSMAEIDAELPEYTYNQIQHSIRRLKDKGQAAVTYQGGRRWVAV